MTRQGTPALPLPRNHIGTTSGLLRAATHAMMKSLMRLRPSLLLSCLLALCLTIPVFGADVAKTGVVAGMSGSPVYFDGKLAGAISLKIGTFTKDAIAGVTPIQNMLDVQKAMAKPAGNANGTPAASPVDLQSETFPEKVALGDGKFLVPIETPLIFSGVMPQTLALFGNQ